VCLVGVEQAGPQQHVEGARPPEVRHEQRGGVRRQAVAQRPRDRHPEPRRLRGDPQVARRGEGEPAADAVAVDGGDGGHRGVLQPAQHPGHPLLVRHARGAVEARELGDVGAGDERPPTGPAQHEHPDVRVGVGLLAGVGHALVHRERQGVVGLGPVERDTQDGAVLLDEEIAHAYSQPGTTRISHVTRGVISTIEKPHCMSLR
jgi:hypothetical protein